MCIESIDFGSSLEVGTTFFLRRHILVQVIERSIFIVILVAADVDDVLMVGVLRSIFICTHHVLVEVLRVADQLQEPLSVAFYFVWIDVPDL